MSDTEKTPIVRGGTRPPPPPPGRTPRASASDTDGIQGEGNRGAARLYNEGVHRHMESGQVEPAARSAREAVERDDGRLEQAEERGREPARLSTSERVRGTANRLRRLVLGLLRRPRGMGSYDDRRPGQTR